VRSKLSHGLLPPLFKDGIVISTPSLINTRFNIQENCTAQILGFFKVLADWNFE